MLRVCINRAAANLRGGMTPVAGIGDDARNLCLEMRHSKLKVRRRFGKLPHGQAVKVISAQAAKNGRSRRWEKPDLFQRDDPEVNGEGAARSEFRL